MEYMKLGNSELNVSRICANCYAWQLAKANALAEKEGFSKFVSVQNHYNLIFREEEREMAQLCDEDNIAMTPYSALASGRLSRRPGETSKRMEEDSYAKLKYDKMAVADQKIIECVAELAEKYNVTMTEISLAWLLQKVTSPVTGATKLHHVEGAAKAVELKLSEEDIKTLEEKYIPHPLAGVMAQNTKKANRENQVWMKNGPKTGASFNLTKEVYNELETPAAGASNFRHLAIEVPGEGTSNEWCEPVDTKSYEALP